MKIYIAARYGRLEEMRRYAEYLQENGHYVTSRWLEGNPEIDQAGSAEAFVDLDDIDSADCVLSFTEDPLSPYGRGGRHVEFGYALARQKGVKIIGPRENIFHQLPHVHQFESVEAFVESISAKPG